jgi:hypothetical protein
LAVSSKGRPIFEDIWRELYDSGFDIIPGITKIDVIKFSGWIEACGSLVN